MHLKSWFSALIVVHALFAAACMPAQRAKPTPPPPAPEPVVVQPAPEPEPEPAPPPAPVLPPVTSVVSFKVKDFDAWKTEFDAGQPARQAAGVLAHHVSRGIDQPRLVLVYFVGADKDKLSAFVAGPELEDAMKKGGLRGKPTTHVLTPLQVVPVTDATLPGVMITYEVNDFDAWKQAFDADATARKDAGVTGESLSRGADNPNLVAVYLQGPDVEPMKTYVASEELAQKMNAAGVKGSPDVQVVRGVEWKIYE